MGWFLYSWPPSSECFKKTTQFVQNATFGLWEKSIAQAYGIRLSHFFDIASISVEIPSISIENLGFWLKY